MKKIIKTISISGLATTLALATNFYIKAEKKECINNTQDIDKIYVQSVNSNNKSDFKLNLSTMGKNIEIKEIKDNIENAKNTINDKIENIKETTTNKMEEIKNNITETNSNITANVKNVTEDNASLDVSDISNKPKTLEATKEDNIMPLIEDNLSPATYPMKKTNSTMETNESLSNNISTSDSEISYLDESETEDLEIVDDETYNTDDIKQLNIELPTEEQEDEFDTNNQEQENDIGAVDEIESTINILNEINSNLTESLEEINNILKDIDVDDIDDEEKEILSSHINFINEKSYELINLSKELLCEITGDCGFNETIQSLSYKIDNLQNAIRSIQLLNNHIASNYRFFSNPQANIYGYSYSFYPNFEQDDQTETEQSNNQDEINENNTNNLVNNQENTENNQTINNIASGNTVATTTNNEKKTKKNIDSYNKRYFTSNIDTYGPKMRNIDSFYNTALFDEYGYGYNMPYYNNFNGQNYGVLEGNGYNNFANYYNPNLNNNLSNENFNSLNGLTSNNGYYNPEFLESKTSEKEVAQENVNIDNANSQTTPLPPEKTNPKRVKFAKNIDTYTDKTMNANINTMNSKKFTDIIKSKFNKWFKKDKVAKQEVDSYVDNFIAENSKIENNTTIKNENLTDNLQNFNQEKTEKNMQEIVSANAIPHKTKDIKDSDLIDMKSIENTPNFEDMDIKKDPITR